MNEKIAIYQFLPNGTLVCSFSSILEASKKTGISRPSITSVCDSDFLYKGFYWSSTPMLSEEKIHKLKSGLISERKKGFSVNQYDLNGKFISTFISANVAEKTLGISRNAILRCCKKFKKYLTAGNYIWRFSDDILTKEEVDAIKQKKEPKEFKIKEPTPPVYKYIDCNTGQKFQSLTECASFYGISENRVKKIIVFNQPYKNIELTYLDSNTNRLSPFIISKERFDKYYPEFKKFVQIYGHMSIPQNYKSNNLDIGVFLTELRVAYRKNTILPEIFKELEKLDKEWYTISCRPDSFPEYCVWRMLVNSFPDALLHDISFGFETDILIKSSKLVFEYDGGRHFEKEKRDIFKTKEYIKNGYTVVRIRTKDIGYLNFNDKNFLQFLHYRSKSSFEEAKEIQNILVEIIDNINSLFKKNLVLKKLNDIEINKILDDYNYISPRWIYMFEFIKSNLGRIDLSSIDTSIIAPNGQSVSDWCIRQRGNRKNGKLSQKQISILDSIGFQWTPKDDHWMKMYNLLLEFQKEHGDINQLIHTQEYKNQPLGSWLYKQRQAYRQSLGLVKTDRHKITTEQIELLEKVGIDWRLTRCRNYKQQAL